METALVIIPTYNEKENVQGITESALVALPEANVLIVDDNSPDGTGELADSLAQKDARIHVLHRAGKQGLGRAYLAGFKWALERKYAYIFEMDADFSHHPDDLPRLLKAVQNGADLALGSRYIGGIRVTNWPLHRLILSRGAAVYVHLITGLPVTDPTGGFKCFQRNVLETIPLDNIHSNGYTFQIEMTHQAWMRGFKIVDIPITFDERRTGNSKMSSDIVREALVMVWRLWFKCGLRRKPPKTGKALR